MVHTILLHHTKVATREVELQRRHDPSGGIASHLVSSRQPTYADRLLQIISYGPKGELKAYDLQLTHPRTPS